MIALDAQELLQEICHYTDTSEKNRVGEEIALSPELAGMKMFDAPVEGLARADDELFAKLRSDEVVWSEYRLPREWLPGAMTVVSFFFPQGEVPRVTNRAQREEPSYAWLHSRIEGQQFINSAAEYACRLLNDAGYEAVAPSVDPGFKTGKFRSNWSERHTAFICDLGTFGLSKGFITDEKGMAGRFMSIVTTAEFDVPARRPRGLYDNCVRCHACVRRCPAGAISPETGKDHAKCAAYMSETCRKYTPRYGCGKCQTGVPCEFRCPKKK